MKPPIKMPRAPFNADGFIPSPQQWNEMASAVEANDRLASGPGIMISAHPDYKVISAIPQAATTQWVLVAIIGTAAGAGKYDGALLSGDSTATASTDFDPSTDGPLPANGTYANPWTSDALVINLAEQYATAAVNQLISHTLTPYSGDRPFLAMGRIMGTTAEATPRTIVYIDANFVQPAIVRLTDNYSIYGYNGGIYYGEIMQGPPYTSLGISELSSDTGSRASGGKSVILINQWEQQVPLGGDSYTNQLPVTGSQFVLAFLCGGDADNYWAFCMQPVQMPTLTIAATTGTTATDIANLHTAITTLSANLHAAGYSL